MSKMNCDANTGKKAYCTRRTVILFITLCLAVGALGIAQLAGWHDIRTVKRLLPIQNDNRLAIDTFAHVTGPQELSITGPAELDFLKKTEIISMRVAAVKQYPQLLFSDYSPVESVFGQIIDSIPWWGTSGLYYFGPGERSIEGPSLRSDCLLNPYLLIGAEFWHPDNLQWNKELVTDATATEIDFPYRPKMSSLKWWADEARAEVVYEFSKYIAAQRPWLDPTSSAKKTMVDLIAYNARDFNLNYIYFSLEDSLNVSQQKHIEEPFFITQFLHRGGSCGYPGGCNNVSPRFPAIEEIAIEKLPARINVLLWKEKPRSIRKQADMLFVLHVR